MQEGTLLLLLFSLDVYPQLHSLNAMAWRKKSIHTWQADAANTNSRTWEVYESFEGEGGSDDTLCRLMKGVPVL
jgi:hypothetical protein